MYDASVNAMKWIDVHWNELDSICFNFGARDPNKEKHLVGDQNVYLFSTNIILSRIQVGIYMYVLQAFFDPWKTNQSL